MQGTARAAAGGHGEVGFAVFNGPLLVSACHRVLEAGGVGAVAGDGYVHALFAHDGHAFADVVAAVAAHFGALALGEGLFADDLQAAFLIMILGAHIGKAVDAADDIGRVLAKAVEDDAQGRLADLVGRLGDADRAFRGREGFMACQEAEALGLLAQELGSQVAVAHAHHALVRDGTGDAESLQAQADGLGRLGGGLDALFHGNARAQDVSPNGVIKGNGLNAAHDGVHVNALFQQHFLDFVQRRKTVLRQNLFDLGDSSFIPFELCHRSHHPLLLMARIDHANRFVKPAVGADVLFVRFLGVHALFDGFHHLAKVHELIADDLVARVHGQLDHIALGHFQIANALGQGAVHGADLGAQALAQVFQAGADGQAALGERALRAAVSDLQEQLAHGGVDRVAYQVRIERFQDRLARQNFGGHGSRVRHAGAADRLHQRFLNDAVLDVERELARALLRRAPADAVRQAGNILNLACLHPTAFFRNRSRTVIAALCNAGHFFHFAGILHACIPLACDQSWD